ncbi:glycoside hydrolase family 25 protein [Hymenobacter chitinivorans]|uniref:Lysozyme n=1 Tax=Hymenobacter chitinivorans DSM 11115 TaxID=1121954 RepID=A0A2M9B5H0_9BACT|nr:glycoside hydrolase family 25 protein [Hymenobacter chitinivorans]PJJ53185.1 lysozyme [Hymenobacter chitinivorans DSM 11115]
MIDAVVDVSHYQSTIDFATVASSGILGLIHKATEGLTDVDPLYASRKPLALGVGLLWGAYHLGHNEDGTAQANHFLSTVQPGPTDLLVLDFEDTGAGASMGLQQAEDFVKQVYQATGRYPGLYATNGYLLQNDAQNSSILQQCWLWITDWAAVAEPVHPPQWNTWTLWQHTNGQTGLPPFAVDGIGPCDRDNFNGSADNLRRLWGAVPASSEPAPALAVQG